MILNVNTKPDQKTDEASHEAWTRQAAFTEAAKTLETRSARGNWNRNMSRVYMIAGLIFMVAGAIGVFVGFSYFEALGDIATLGFTYVGFGVALIAIGLAYRQIVNDKPTDIVLTGIVHILTTQMANADKNDSNIQHCYHEYKTTPQQQPTAGDIPEGAHGNYIS